MSYPSMEFIKMSKECSFGVFQEGEFCAVVVELPYENSLKKNHAESTQPDCAPF